MLCETCSKEIETTACPHCRADILRLGPYCYLCGRELTVEHPAATEPAGDDDDFSKRVLCSDGSCIGVINEKGICKVCGKPYTPGSE